MTVSQIENDIQKYNQFKYLYVRCDLIHVIDFVTRLHIQEKSVFGDVADYN